MLTSESIKKIKLRLNQIRLMSVIMVMNEISFGNAKPWQYVILIITNGT